MAQCEPTAIQARRKELEDEWTETEHWAVLREEECRCNVQLGPPKDHACSGEVEQEFLQRRSGVIAVSLAVRFIQGVNTMNGYPMTMEELTDPAELAEAKAQREQFDRNAAWLHVHAQEIYPGYRGQCICIAGQELFVATTAKEALALASAAHPDDKGRFVHHIPKDKVARIYAH